MILFLVGLILICFFNRISAPLFSPEIFIISLSNSVRNQKLAGILSGNGLNHTALCGEQTSSPTGGSNPQSYLVFQNLCLHLISQSNFFQHKVHVSLRRESRALSTHSMNYCYCLSLYGKGYLRCPCTGKIHSTPSSPPTSQLAEVC